MILGLHANSKLKTETIALSPGCNNVHSFQWQINIKCTGGHSSLSQISFTPIFLGSSMLTEINNYLIY
jgi:metal-dependent amidase/aminoacylase/carboxypeptidase family protein